MEATNEDLEWARAKLRWMLERIATKLELEAQLHRRVAKALRGARR